MKSRRSRELRIGPSPRLAAPPRTRWPGALLPAVVAASSLALGACGDRGDRSAEPPPEEPRAVVQPPGGTMTVVVHFTRAERPVPVARSVPAAPSELHAALEALLRGPTDGERAGGISSFFSAETASHLRSVEVDAHGRAVVDFEDFTALIPGASSSAGSAVLLAELHRTVFANSDARTVEYRLEGSCDAFWNWLQYECRIVEREAAAPGRP